MNLISRRPWGFIDPNSVFFVLWNVFLALLVLYTTFTLPFVLAFYSEDGVSSAYETFTFVVDLFFLLDILIQFRTGIVSPFNSEVVLFDQKLIFWTYMKGFFILDLLSSLPFDYLLSNPDLRATQLLKTLKTVKIIKVARIFKLLRIAKLTVFLNKLEEYLDNILKPATIRLLFTALWLLIITHLGACVWFGASRVIPSDLQPNWVQKMYSNFHNGTFDPGISKSELYLNSVYWSVSTLTSVGYGDISAVNDFERVVAVLICWTGATVFGFILGYLSQIIGAMNRTNSQFHERMDRIHAYLRYRQVPRVLKRKIIRYFRYYFTKMSVFDEKQILNDLSNYLRVELSMFLTAGVLSTVTIFQDIIDPSFFSMIVTMLRPLSVSKDEFVYQFGDVSTEIYILIRGEIVMYNKSGIILSTVGSGSHFGDNFTRDFGQKLRRVNTAKASQESDLFSLSKEDIKKVMNVFPEIKKKIEKDLQVKRKVLENLQTKAKMLKLATDANQLPEQVNKRRLALDLNAVSGKITRTSLKPNQIRRVSLQKVLEKKYHEPSSRRRSSSQRRSSALTSQDLQTSWNIDVRESERFLSQALVLKEDSKNATSRGSDLFKKFKKVCK
eukprot:maker-scaffold_22-snap-gene-2.52-mRNA-1 protein AED:0.40 eAED:0.41 QI:0/0/0/1/1/1/2/0/611